MKKISKTLDKIPKVWYNKFNKTRTVYKTRKEVEVMETNTNVVRVTKAQKFEFIKSIIPADASHTFPATVDSNGNVKKSAYVFDHDEIVAFIDEQLNLLARKNSGDKKKTPDQEKNDEYKAAIMAYLDTLPATNEDGTPFMGVTCTDVLKNVPELSEFQVQKSASLLRKLRDEDGLVTSCMVKGKHLFKKA